jgi:hypothetical protein
MDGDSDWFWHKFRIGCVAFAVIFVIAYLICIELIKTFMQSIPQIVGQPPAPLSSGTCLIMLVPAFFAGIVGAFGVASLYESWILRMTAPGGRRRGRRYR